MHSFLYKDMPEEIKTIVLDMLRKKKLFSKHFLGQFKSKVSTLKLPKLEKITTNTSFSFPEEDKHAQSSKRRTKQYHKNLTTML